MRQVQADVEQKENASEDVNQVQNVLENLNASNLNDEHLNTWVGLIGANVGKLSDRGVELTDEKATGIIRDQIVRRTKFGQLLKETRRKSGEDLSKEVKGLGPIDEKSLKPADSLLRAIVRYLNFGDVQEMLGGGKKTAAVEACEALMNDGALAQSENLDPDLKLQMGITTAGLNQTLSPEEAKEIVAYHVKAMTDIGLALDAIKTGQENIRKRFAQIMGRMLEKTNEVARKHLCKAFFEYVGIAPEKQSSDVKATQVDSEKIEVVTENKKVEAEVRPAQQKKAPSANFKKALAALNESQLNSKVDGEINWTNAHEILVPAVTKVNEFLGKHGIQKLTSDEAESALETMYSKSPSFGAALDSVKNEPRPLLKALPVGVLKTYCDRNSTAVTKPIYKAILNYVSSGQ